MEEKQKRLDELRSRYERALHAMQTGVALDETHDPSSMSAKHLRVGVNSALIDSGALAAVLIKKGVLTEDEYLESLAEFAERDKESYEQKFSQRFGRKITLG